MRRRTAVLGGLVLITMAAVGVAPAAAEPSPAARTTGGAHALAAALDHATAVHGGTGQTFQITGVLRDTDGTSHTRMTRRYANLPVLGGDLVVHESASGTWKGVSETLATAPTEASPAITATRAKPAAPFGNRKVRGPAQLVIEARTPSRTPRLAWRFRTEGTQQDGTPSRAYVSVDALTGKVLLREETIETDAGDGRSLYGGTVPLETTKSGSTYQLKDATRGGTYTGDAGNKADVCFLTFCLSRAPATLFTDADNHWGNGTTSDRATAAVDAQYGTNTTWDFYKNTFGRVGIAGDGKGSFNRVHYDNGYNNAFWDDSCFCMTYGDGDGTQMGPLVALDVAGHEMSHGVTSSTAGLTYSGESGGLNEATSDILGTAVEWFANNAGDPGDYLIGEKIVRPGFGAGALRYMDRPSRDGDSADFWSSGVGNLDVHYSSGVANHFFYLLAEGSGAKTINGVGYDSPTSNGSTVTGIGRDAAVRIWYRALTTYMTSSTNYAGARTATLNATRDLYGTGSTQYNTVAAAWSAVNVN
jgi:Zn-dependent metalloprotease